MEKFKRKNQKEPNVFVAFIPLIAVLVMLLLSLFKYKIDIQIPLIAATIIAALISVYHLNCTWNDIEKGIVKSITSAMQAIIIACIIGMIIASWIMGGIVPAIIYYGLQIISPQFFLVSSLTVSAVLGISTGSSWTTCGTIGVALIGIGIGLGIPVAMTAGSVISGAYLGDKMSPFSDTTNLASAVSGTNLFVHIKNMMWTTGTSFILAAILFQILNYKFVGQRFDYQGVLPMMEAINNNFNINIFLIIPVFLLIIMMIRQIPAIPGLILGVFLGIICALLFQSEGISRIGNALQYGFEAKTGIETVDKMLSLGGMQKMMWTVSLILCSLTFGGVMKQSGMIEQIGSSMMRIANGISSLIVSTMFTSLFVTISTGEQYLSILLTGKMYKDEYQKRNLAPENLSRALEDVGTITSPLVPWSTCAVAVSAYLGVSTMDYFPYCFLNLVNPVIATFFVIIGFKIKKISENKK